MRYPIKASRDPRISLPERASSRPDWAAHVPGWSQSVADTLANAVRTLCPHDWLDETVYRTAALEIARAASFEGEPAACLRSIMADLDASGFAKASERERIAILTGLERTPQFRQLQRAAVRVLYNDPEVWAGCGYEGVEGCLDTGPRAAINDLDWLPEPDFESVSETEQ